MKLIIGLGNPGAKYAKTRHNVGFMVMDFLASKDSWQENKKAMAFYLKKEIDGQLVELLKPQTFMNDSGLAVAYAVKNHHLDVRDIFVVYDDIALPLSKIRIGRFASAGGHKGMQSIIDNLKSSDFIRFRVGIKNAVADKQPADLPAEARRAKAGKFVMQKFGLLEKKPISEAVAKTAEAVQLALTEPLEKVMNKYN